MSEFQIRLRRRNIPDADLIADLQDVSRQLEAPTITRQQYDEHGSFGATTVLRRLGTWNSALELAGLDVVHRQHIPSSELFENLADVWMALGKQPFGRQMSDKATGSKFALGTYEKRFGSWNEALIAFAQFIGQNDSSNESVLESGTARRTIRTKRTSRDVNWRLRARILIRDNCICRMCGASPAKDSSVVLHVDHILAWDLGGETVEENLQTLCEPCNIGKSNIDIRPLKS